MTPRHWTLTVAEAIWACRWIGPVVIDGDARDETRPIPLPTCRRLCDVGFCISTRPQSECARPTDHMNRTEEDR